MGGCTSLLPTAGPVVSSYSRPSVPAPSSKLSFCRTITKSSFPSFDLCDIGHFLNLPGTCFWSSCVFSYIHYLPARPSAGSRSPGHLVSQSGRPTAQRSGPDKIRSNSGATAAGHLQHCQIAYLQRYLINGNHTCLGPQCSDCLQGPPKDRERQRDRARAPAPAACHIQSRKAASSSSSPSSFSHHHHCPSLYPNPPQPCPALLPGSPSPNRSLCFGQPGLSTFHHPPTSNQPAPFPPLHTDPGRYAWQNAS